MDNPQVATFHLSDSTNNTKYHSIFDIYKVRTGPSYVSTSVRKGFWNGIYTIGGIVTLKALVTKSFKPYLSLAPDFTPPIEGNYGTVVTIIPLFTLGRITYDWYKDKRSNYFMPTHENDPYLKNMFVFSGTAFFLFGGIFCYFLVPPLGLKFLLAYGSNYWKMQVTIGFYFSFVVKLIMAFAFAFQTPLIMVLLTKFGVINTVKMKLYRKWAFLGTFLLAAILTPPDIITQVLLAIPLYGLYEFGMVVSRFFENPKNREMAIRQMQAEAEARRAAKEAVEKAAEMKKAAAKKAKKIRKVVR